MIWLQLLLQLIYSIMASQVALKNTPASAGDIRDLGSIPALGRSPGGGHGYALQYSCLENSVDSGAWCATSPEGHALATLASLFLLFEHTMLFLGSEHLLLLFPLPGPPLLLSWLVPSHSLFTGTMS